MFHVKICRPKTGRLSSGINPIFATSVPHGRLLKLRMCLGASNPTHRKELSILHILQYRK